MGVTGDAIATVIGTIAASIISIIFVLRNSDFLSLHGLFNFRMLRDKVIIRSIRSKATNIVLENIFMRIGFLLSSIIVSTLESGETAVYSVGMILFNCVIFYIQNKKGCYSLKNNSLSYYISLLEFDHRHTECD